VPGLADRVDVLWPATVEDSYTQTPRADWTKDPQRVVDTVRATVQPVSSDEDAVTAETVVSAWHCWLPPHHRTYEGAVVDLAAEMTTACRVRWDGDVYLIDGDVERWKSGRRVRRLYCRLKRVS
jgi:hypothetical protein